MGRNISSLAALALALCLLTGCSALLERTYSTAEPHSSKFWESEAAGTLRAENHQDVVNDLLLLVGQHRERPGRGGHPGAGGGGGPAGDPHGGLRGGVYHGLQPVPEGIL